MARLELKEFFPRFLREHPAHGLSALIGAMEGYISRRNSNSSDQEEARSWAITAQGRQVRLREDLSHIWAWNPDEEHGDNTLGLLRAFRDRLRSAEPIDLRAIVEHVINSSELAVIWTRTLLVAAERPDVVGDLLWPIATQEPFLRCPDTTKDAVDFVANRYPFEAQVAKELFELAIMPIEFPSASDPEAARRHFLERLFGRVGDGSLVTVAARQFVPADQAPEVVQRRNRRPFQIESYSTSPSSFWWIREAGVDVNALDNAALLTETTTAKEALGLDGNSQLADLTAAVQVLQRLRVSASASPAAPLVVEYADGILAQGIAKFSWQPVDLLRANADVVQAVLPLLEYVAGLPFPEAGPDIEASFEKSASWGSPAPRIDAAEAIMNLSHLDRAYLDRFRPIIERLLADPHPGVRLQIADRLISLWAADQDWMWHLGGQIAHNESNRGVLKFFANYFLQRAVHHAPQQIEQLTLVLRDRPFPREGTTDDFLEEIGSLFAILWISHGTETSQSVIKGWLADAPMFEPELGHAIAVSREALTLKYHDDDARAVEITRRAQEFAAWVAEATATGLEDYLRSVVDNVPTEESKNRGTMFAKLLNNLCDQSYFSSGSFRHGPNETLPLATEEAKRAFLSDSYSILRRIADAGTPGTIHHLVELLEFLMPADSLRVFDLVAHALLGAGKRHGYQFESLGADRFVAMIGQFLADHRDMFANDEPRRRQLIACLDAFMEAGWPSARRLLYRLPELLQ